ncbi:unnamed protein product [Acanthoscelides obtectus]|uniref:Uncharacterized protein n=1 Tax=Acanthoscelides obtectus TaxID=200917 RepID=A0A9P0PLB8_ACAOB|nr:unnamed protein product [Acanthoscelides obtectus]CAK1661201.1 hypothetical protein AOBTE_LOCUS22510 [Acanthoscelides obtectus]
MKNAGTTGISRNSYIMNLQLLLRIHTEKCILKLDMRVEGSISPPRIGSCTSIFTNTYFLPFVARVAYFVS